MKREHYDKKSVLKFMIYSMAGIFVFFGRIPVGGTAVQATGNILCAIFLSSVFVPLLLEDGLVDAAGVIFRPLMRKLFLTPGSSLLQIHKKYGMLWKDLGIF